MCGIAGLFLKNADARADLGRHLTAMLTALAARGPDSTGAAFYGDAAPGGMIRLTLYRDGSKGDAQGEPPEAWSALARVLGEALGAAVSCEDLGRYAIIATPAAERDLRAWLAENRPALAVMGAGRRMAIFKDRGRAGEVAKRYGFATIAGSHAVGHTRMATESVVSTRHAHPFGAAEDVSLVHNGSLSNHNRLRGWLARRGYVCETDNDTEVAARFIAWRLGEGAPLAQALEDGLEALDGFFTFAVGTADGFAVVRDPIACKPAVLAETEDWVAMASEYRALVSLPGVENARIWEPKPAQVYTWSHAGAA